MAIAGTDILTKLSKNDATAGNQATSTLAKSLGNFISTSAITDASLNNLFEDIGGDDNAASAYFYKCFFIHNNHATLTWQGVFVWISAASGNTTANIGLDTTAVSALASGTAQAVTAATNKTAPAGISFSAPVTKAGGLSVGDIAAGSVKAIWVRIQAANIAAENAASVTVKYEGDTGA
jgi:hypothetical protein